MVDVKVLEDQLKEAKLDPKTELKIRKLLKNSKVITQLQASILQSIINGAIKDVNKIKSPEQATLFSMVNIFTTTKASEKLISYQSNIGKIFQLGIKFSNSSPSKTVSMMEEGVKQSSMRFITKMGDDLKTRAGEIVADGIGKSIPTNDIVANLEHELQITRARANTIARTETMRAAHAGSYGQAIRDGQNYYIIDSRAEACDECLDEYDGQVFSIDDAGSMPPLHPNCACVPVYFSSEEAAQEWSDMVSQEIADQRQAIEDSGKTIPSDGTGAETNKSAAEERIHN